MDVDAAARQRVEHGARQDLAVRDDDRELGARSRRSASRSSPVRADLGWITGSPSSSAATLTAGAVSWLPRPAGLSGWRDDERDLVRPGERAQARHGELGRAHEHDAHRGPCITRGRPR